MLPWDCHHGVVPTVSLTLLPLSLDMQKQLMWTVALTGIPSLQPAVLEVPREASFEPLFGLVSLGSSPGGTVGSPQGTWATHYALEVRVREVQGSY